MGWNRLMMSICLGLLAISPVVAADESNELRVEYLELRDINYDFAQKYREYLESKRKENNQNSSMKALEYKKSFNSYLLKLPETAVVHNPNGYYSSDEKFGYNPLLWKPINDNYKNKKFLLEDDGNRIFVGVDSNAPVEMEIEKGSDFQGQVDQKPALDESALDEANYAVGADGLPLMDEDTAAGAGAPNNNALGGDANAAAAFATVAFVAFISLFKIKAVVNCEVIKISLADCLKLNSSLILISFRTDLAPSVSQANLVI